MTEWPIWLWISMASTALAVTAHLSYRIQALTGQPGSREALTRVIIFLLFYAAIYYGLAFLVHFAVSLPGGWGGGATWQLSFYIATIASSVIWKVLYASAHFVYPSPNTPRKETRFTAIVLVGGVVITGILGIVTGILFFWRSIAAGVIMLVVILILIIVYAIHFYQNWDFILGATHLRMHSGTTSRSITNIAGVRSGNVYSNLSKGGMTFQ